MSDSDVAPQESRSARAAQQATPPVPRGGRGLAALATLLALVAVGIAAYPYYRRAVEGETIGTAASLDGLRVEQQRQASQLRELIDRGVRGTALVDDTSAAPARLSAPVGTSPLSSGSRGSLQLAEAEFLLRSARDHLLVDRDPHAALALVLAAQSLVDAIDDSSLPPVRASLTKHVATLRGAADVDIAGLVDRLQALIDRVGDLPARGVRFGATAQHAVNEAVPASAWDTAWEKFRSLFAFRRQGAAERPPLGPDAATYLRLNLALMLQNTQFALLRRDAGVYQQSLVTVRRWLDDYLDTNAPEVADARAEIDRLADIRLDRPLPDLSDSLDALRAALNASFQPPVSGPAAVDTPVAVGDVQHSGGATERPAGESR